MSIRIELEPDEFLGQYGSAFNKISDPNKKAAIAEKLVKDNRLAQIFRQTILDKKTYDLLEQYNLLSEWLIQRYELTDYGSPEQKDWERIINEFSEPNEYKPFDPRRPEINWDMLIGAKGEAIGSHPERFMPEHLRLIGMRQTDSGPMILGSMAQSRQLMTGKTLYFGDPGIPTIPFTQPLRAHKRFGFLGANTDDGSPFIHNPVTGNDLILPTKPSFFEEINQNLDWRQIAGMSWVVAEK